MKTYYKNQKSCPLASSPKHAARLLQGSNVTASIGFSDKYKTTSTQIEEKHNTTLAAWWTSTDSAKKDFISPGQTTYVVGEESADALRALGQQPSVLDINSVRTELEQAHLHLPPKSLQDFHEKMLHVIEDFSDIFNKYTAIAKDKFVMRIWQIYAPKGALGRTPYLHTDHSILTGMWYPYANRAPAEFYAGDVPEHVWAALQPERKGKKRGKLSKKDHQNSLVLQDFTNQASPKDLVTLPSGALIVAKNLKDRADPTGFKDLSKQKARESIFLHKSGDVKSTGQVGLIMIPQILR